jgi:hypothetical protein
MNKIKKTTKKLKNEGKKRKIENSDMNFERTRKRNKLLKNDEEISSEEEEEDVGENLEFTVDPDMLETNLHKNEIKKLIIEENEKNTELTLDELRIKKAKDYLNKVIEFTQDDENNNERENETIVGKKLRKEANIEQNRIPKNLYRSFNNIENPNITFYKGFFFFLKFI